MHKYFAWFFIVLSAFTANAEEMAQNTINKESAWFLPSLSKDNHQVCTSYLKKTADVFLSNNAISSYYLFGAQSIESNSMKKISHFFDNDPDVIFEKVEMKRGGRSSYKVEVPTIYMNGKKIYFHKIRHPGCGGACEREELLVSNQGQPESSNVPTPANSYSLYKDENKTYWQLFFDRSDNLQVLRLLDSGKWEHSCEIKLRPEKLENSTDVDIQKALTSLNKLKTSVFGLTRGAGSCGSMRTHSRWTSAFSSNLPKVLYRPWALEENPPTRREDFDTYSKDIAGLNDWALMGLSEYESFQNYLALLDKTIADISTFYQKKFAWEKSKSEAVARIALTSSVSQTIRFYYYNPISSDTERALRKAILEQRPINEIKTINYKIIDSGHDGGESLLSLAVMHPDALQYLLSKGLNPNHQNDFGKTPLIYAVQYNQPESVKLLLEAGADPNVKTTKPVNNCFYTIRTFNMTPLHYAVRYASPEIIKMLLNHGAATFIKAENHQGYGDKDTALDWLNIYTNKFEEERNPNISDEMINTVKKWVKPVDLESSPDIANEYVLEAEKLYEQNKVTKSYQMLGLALALQPDNERALSDMSLIALKNGKLGQSIAAGDKLIKNSTSDKLKANAWYNQGLACEKHISNLGGGFLSYNGQYHCKYGYLYPFYKAVVTHSTETRKNKILELFNEHSVGYCDISEKGIKINTRLGDNPETAKYDQLQSLFVLHDSNTDISGDMISWKMNYGNEGMKRIVPEKKGFIDLGKKTLTLFGTKAHLPFPYYVMGFKCKDNKSKAVKIDLSE